MRADRVVAVAALVATVLAGCTARGGEPAGTELFDRIRPSLALISTPSSTGSAELVEGGYLVTNAHVVDPYRRVDVQFEGEGWIEHVPVVGVDLVADLAVVGPVDVDAEPLQIVAPAEPVRGRAYLMGYPGDQVDAHAKLHPGRLVGQVPTPHWGLTYLRSTTPIYGGQSGGALVDGQGRVVGVSALEDDDGTALSLRGDQVAARVRRILAGKGSPWESEPNPPTRRRFEVRSPGPDGVAAFHVTPAEDDRAVTVEVRASAGTPVVALAEPRQATWPTRASQSALDDPDAVWWATDDDTRLLRGAGPGRWRFSLEAFADRLVLVSSTEPGARLSIRFDVPVAPVDVEDPVRDLAVPGRARAYVDAVDDEVGFELHLEAGERVRITARTPSGDADWDLVPSDDPDVTVAGRHTERGGLFDTDDTAVVTAPSTGTYVLWAMDLDDTATALDVSVVRA